LVIIGVIGFFLAYLLSPRSKSRNTGDARSERAYARFVRASSLLLVAGLGVAAVTLSVAAPGSQTSALFALLGTVAGYIAGSRRDEDQVPANPRPKPGEE
jgi:hypothetical protein